MSNLPPEALLLFFLRDLPFLINLSKEGEKLLLKLFILSQALSIAFFPK